LPSSPSISKRLGHISIMRDTDRRQRSCLGLLSILSLERRVPVAFTSFRPYRDACKTLASRSAFLVLLYYSQAACCTARTVVLLAPSPHLLTASVNCCKEHELIFPLLCTFPQLPRNLCTVAREEHLHTRTPPPTQFANGSSVFLSRISPSSTRFPVDKAISSFIIPGTQSRQLSSSLATISQPDLLLRTS
jgi:hypothetical protein